MEGHLLEYPQYMESDVQNHRKHSLADPNLFLWKKYPHLQNAAVIDTPNKSKSVLNLRGVRLRQEIDGKTTHWFVCLVGTCYHKRVAISLHSTSTANGTSHLQAKHNIVASKTSAHQRNVATIVKHIEGADASFKQDPTRWFQVNFLALACEHSLSINAFESLTWKVIASKLPVSNQKTLANINVRKHYVEHYVTIKQDIIAQIDAAKDNMTYHLSLFR